MVVESPPNKHERDHNSRDDASGTSSGTSSAIDFATVPKTMLTSVRSGKAVTPSDAQSLSSVYTAVSRQNSPMRDGLVDENTNDSKMLQENHAQNSNGARKRRRQDDSNEVASRKSRRRVVDDDNNAQSGIRIHDVVSFSKERNNVSQHSERPESEQPYHNIDDNHACYDNIDTDNDVDVEDVQPLDEPETDDDSNDDGDDGDEERGLTENNEEDGGVTFGQDEVIKSRELQDDDGEQLLEDTDDDSLGDKGHLMENDEDSTGEEIDRPANPNIPRVITTTASPSQAPSEGEVETSRGATNLDRDHLLPQISNNSRKVAGRRRAPHADPNVEAALRRQLHLRVRYRAVAKQLRPLLVELTKRTIEALTNDIEAHTKVTEYKTVEAQLDAKLEERLTLLDVQKQFERDKLDLLFKMEQDVCHMKYRQARRNAQGGLVNKIKFDLLTTIRKHDQEIDKHASDDEDNNIIPSLWHVNVHGRRKHLLHRSYDSRSRRIIETDRLYQELSDRRVEFVTDGEVAKVASTPCPFTFLEPERRNAHQHEKNLAILISALKKQIPRRSTKRTIKKDNGDALQMLAMTVAEHNLTHKSNDNVRPADFGHILKIEDRPVTIKQEEPSPRFRQQFPEVSITEKRHNITGLTEYRSASSLPVFSDGMTENARNSQSRTPPNNATERLVRSSHGNNIEEPHMRVRRMSTMSGRPNRLDGPPAGQNSSSPDLRRASGSWDGQYRSRDHADMRYDQPNQQHISHVDERRESRDSQRSNPIYSQIPYQRQMSGGSEDHSREQYRNDRSLEYVRRSSVSRPVDSRPVDGRRYEYSSSTQYPQGERPPSRSSITSQAPPPRYNNHSDIRSRDEYQASRHQEYGQPPARPQQHLYNKQEMSPPTGYRWPSSPSMPRPQPPPPSLSQTSLQDRYGSFRGTNPVPQVTRSFSRYVDQSSTRTFERYPVQPPREMSREMRRPEDRAPLQVMPPVRQYWPGPNSAVLESPLGENNRYPPIFDNSRGDRPGNDVGLNETRDRRMSDRDARTYQYSNKQR